MKVQREQVHSDQSGRVAGIVTTFLLFICILSVAFYTYMKSINASASPQDILQILQLAGSRTVKEAQVQYSFDYDSRGKPVFALYDGYIVKCSNDGILALDRNGAVVWSEGLAFNKPMIKTNGKQLLAADIGGTDIYIIDGSTVKWRERLDAAILNADIGEDGYVTVVTTAKRDNNEVRVFEPHGTELFRKIIANDFAVSAVVTPSEHMLAISSISTGAVGAYSKYKFYDIQGKDLAEQSFEENGELLPLFWYNHDGSLFAAGDRSAAYMDKSGKTVWEKQFTNVVGAGPVGNRYLAVAAEDHEGVRLALYTKDGQEFSSGRLSEKPIGLASMKGIIGVYSYDTVHFYNEKCENIARYSSGSSVQQIGFFDRQQVVVITDHQVSVISIN